MDNKKLLSGSDICVKYISKKEPNLKGFSAKNLWRMKQFFETYKENEKLATLCREISWSHNRLKWVLI